MVHCCDEGEAVATARWVRVPPTVGESGGKMCVDMDSQMYAGT
jgi:hypothetical protein